MSLEQFIEKWLPHASAGQLKELEDAMIQILTEQPISRTEVLRQVREWLDPFQYYYQPEPGKE